MPALTLSQLESHLWKAAWLPKGPVHAADFKTYLFPLLFFKRLSDVHDEEHEAALKEFEGDEEAALFPENYRLQVPEGCHWRDVRKVAVNVGQASQTALRGIEQANPDINVIVKQIVADIDSMVSQVCFDGWQTTAQGECDIKQALRRALLRYNLCTDPEPFEKAQGYIRQYY